MSLPTAVQLIAMTLYLESANQGRDGHMAVASVIWCSSDGQHNAVDLVNEIQRPKRFSCWNKRKISTDVIKDEILVGLYADIPEVVKVAWEDCMEIALSMVNGTFTPSFDATHYHAKSVSPGWARKMVKVCTVKDHIFFKEAI